MRLFHVSDQGDIAHFAPRIPPSMDARIAHPVVWAVDGEHLANYLVPRNCPRVCFRANEDTTNEDRQRFLRADAAPVVAIEESWFRMAEATPLWIYEFAPQPFASADRNAGYFVASVSVTPLACRRIECPLAELAARGAELRGVRDLRTLAADVTRSTLAFSCIRMRNATPV
ncbi:DUF6886 family protein [Chthoniobacter flavus]|uniref:DUF6886 family protein n=1 Tax=Chthoniobacter flavus TaxID=191863 RepID=UPI0005B257FC|nr:DUF6886 family protein [Chthoniobacter flavus]